MDNFIVITILITIMAIAVFVAMMIIKAKKITSVKAMLFGIGLMILPINTLGIFLDDNISAIVSVSGLAFLIGGFINKEK